MPTLKERADTWLAKNNGLTTLVFLGVVIAPFIWLFTTQESSQSTPAVPKEAHATTGSGVNSKEAKELAALMLNLNKFLCAEVLEIRPLQVQTNIHEVTCIEYRGGSGQKTYLIDANKGTAWSP